jgi:CRP-like cAMP-binding protein
MEQQIIINSLQQSVLFNSLPLEALQKIAKKAKTRQYFPSDTIVWQGKPSDSLYLITNGIVVVKKVLSAEKEHIFAYLMAGNTFGEVGILENQARSATVAALSDVDVVVLQRSDFLDILHEHPQVAVELAKMLGRYLVESNRRNSRRNKNAKLILLFDTFDGAGASSIGFILTRMLRDKTGKPTVYTEYPTSQQIISDLKIDRRDKTYKHPAGYDIAISQESNDETFLPIAARTTLMIDNLMGDYDNIVITLNGSLTGGLDENIIMMLDYANQIIILMPPNDDVWNKVEDTLQRIRKHTKSNDTTIFTIVNRSEISEQHTKISMPHDFELPFLADFPPLELLEETKLPLPRKLSDLVSVFIDRLERTHQVAMFIPTTLDVDIQIDTGVYVKKALNFLAKCFGGATSKEAEGVWNSKDVGLVGEKVFIVHTYVTHADLNQYLDEVIEFVKSLKTELKQEAMALEVNGKLTLI